MQESSCCHNVCMATDKLPLVTHSIPALWLISTLYSTGDARGYDVSAYICTYEENLEPRSP